MVVTLTYTHISLTILTLPDISNKVQCKRDVCLHHQQVSIILSSYVERRQSHVPQMQVPHTLSCLHDGFH